MHYNLFKYCNWSNKHVTKYTFFNLLLTIVLNLSLLVFLHAVGLNTNKHQNRKK